MEFKVISNTISFPIDLIDASPKAISLMLHLLSNKELDESWTTHVFKKYFKEIENKGYGKSVKVYNENSSRTVYHVFTDKKESEFIPNKMKEENIESYYIRDIKDSIKKENNYKDPDVITFKNETIYLSKLEKYWNENVKFARKSTDINSRQRDIFLILKKYGKQKIQDTLNKFFNSPFLNLEEPSVRNGRAFTLGWFFTPGNFLKIMEGLYDRDKIEAKDKKVRIM